MAESLREEQRARFRAVIVALKAQGAEGPELARLLSTETLAELEERVRSSHDANLAMTSAETRIAELEGQLAAARSALGAEAAQDDVSGDLAGSGSASGPEGHPCSSSRSNRLNRKGEVRGSGT